MSDDPRIRTLKAILALKGDALKAALARIKHLDREHAVNCGDCDQCIDERAPDWREENG